MRAPRAVPALAAVLLLAAGASASAPPRRLLGAARSASPPMALAFQVTPSVAAPNLPKWLDDGDGKGVKLLANGYTQSSGGSLVNKAVVAEGGEAPSFTPVRPGGDGTGVYAPLLRLELSNGGAMQPMDVGAPIVKFTAALKPVALHGGPDAPPASDPLDLTFSAMWTPGNGAPPNNAGVFNLVHPLPSKEFIAYGVPHRITVTGLRPAAGSPPGLKGQRPWWDKEKPAEAGTGAVVVPMDGAKYEVELLAEVHVV